LLVASRSYLANKEQTFSKNKGDLKPTRAPAVQSFCAMNKERVNSNGCETVSTLSEQSERQ